MEKLHAYRCYLAMQNTHKTLNRHALTLGFRLAMGLVCAALPVSEAEAHKISRKHTHEAHHAPRHGKQPKRLKVTKSVLVDPKGFQQRGIASIYHARLDKRARGGNMTMAHRNLPKGTHVVIQNEQNKKSVCVLVTDRGPYIAGRVADLSMPAGRAIGLTMQNGITQVSLRTVEACP